MAGKQLLTRKLIARVFIYTALTIAMVWALMPIVWMVLSSLKTQAGMFSMPPKFIFKPTFSTYAFMFNEGNFGLFLKNSVIASLSSTFIALVLGTLGGYALARGNYKGAKHIAFWIISTRMTPIAAAIVPLYLIFAKFHLMGTALGLVIAYTTFNLPFALWMMMTFFAELPPDMEHAAMVDGATKFQAFYKIALPQVAPGLVATGILCLMFAWNDFAFASVFTSHKTQTIPVAVSLLVSQTGIAWGQAMATGTVIILPMLVAGLAVRKYLVRGLSMGAIK
ncbi:MAG: carbohydrate ABC transporter permease [Desulfotomaculum sp.]|nr:carbohydrate ABC transporter permease [Desulfotomaculum sp.]